MCQRSLSLVVLPAALSLAMALIPTRAAAAGRGPALWQELQREVAAVAERTLRRVGATAEQRARIRRELGAAALEVRGLMPEALTLADQVAEAVFADEPDAAALAKLEQETLLLASRGGAVVRQRVLAAALALTPAQRAELLEMWRSARRR